VVTPTIRTEDVFARTGGEEFRDPVAHHAAAGLSVVAERVASVAPSEKPDVRFVHENRAHPRAA